MNVELAYGTTGLSVDLPDGTDVVTPRHQPAAASPDVALRQALRRPVAGEPLRRLAAPGQSVAISICDVTRPQPREAMLRAILDELDGVVDPADITVLVATGTHRGTTPDELDRMLGPELTALLRVVDHDGLDESALRWCGVLGDGVPVWLNRAWLDADVRITTGFVEPHFFAGFSGGPKLVAPGLAGLETVLTLHDARRIGDPRATWGVCTGNPVHDDVRAIAAATGVTFAFDVVLDHRQQVVQAFGGELFAMHAAARAVVRAGSMRAVDAAYDVVVTSNAGYPLDQNLYQAVKGMSAAASVVRPGGLIVVAAECSDGFPDHGGFRAELVGATSPAELLAQITGRSRTEPDQWQLQILAGILTKARVGLHARGLTPDQVAGAHLQPVDDIAQLVADDCERIAVQEKRKARVCALPEGPQTIPYVARATQRV